jgi:hypothetical protein
VYGRDSIACFAANITNEAMGENPYLVATRAANLATFSQNTTDGNIPHGEVEAGARIREWLAQIDLLRDIFGNPFRPVSISPGWLTPTVTNLATAAYEERILPSGELDSARLAVLADALEEAGCDSADVLSHLREPGPHVRGCWVVDLLLDKG